MERGHLVDAALRAPSRARRLVLLGATGLAACAGQPETVRIEPPPAVAAAHVGPTPGEVALETTPEEAAAGEAGAHCEKRASARDKASCLLQSGDEAAIDTIAAAAQTGSVAGREFAYAAESAGILAAKTADVRLHAFVDSADERDQVFGVLALRHELATLRLGYARGGEADAKIRAARLSRAHAACVTKIAARDASLARSAGDCLGEVHDAADAAALIDAASSQPDPLVQSHLVEIAGRAPPIPEKSLKKLAPLLERQLGPDWAPEELLLRARVCRLLLQEAPAAAWARKAAATAVREIGDRQSQTREPCEKLARGAR